MPLLSHAWQTALKNAVTPKSSIRGPLTGGRTSFARIVKRSGLIYDMRGRLADTRSILGWLAGELSPDTFLNLMDQYRPAHKAETDPQFSEIGRPLLSSEFRQAVACAEAAGLWRLDGR